MSGDRGVRGVLRVIRIMTVLLHPSVEKHIQSLAGAACWLGAQLYPRGCAAIFISTAAHMNDSGKPRGSKATNSPHSLFYYKKRRSPLCCLEARVEAESFVDL